MISLSEGRSGRLSMAGVTDFCTILPSFFFEIFPLTERVKTSYFACAFPLQARHLCFPSRDLQERSREKRGAPVLALPSVLRGYRHECRVFFLDDDRKICCRPTFPPSKCLLFIEGRGASSLFFDRSAVPRQRTVTLLPLFKKKVFRSASRQYLSASQRNSVIFFLLLHQSLYTHEQPVRPPLIFYVSTSPPPPPLTLIDAGLDKQRLADLYRALIRHVQSGVHFSFPDSSHSPSESGISAKGNQGGLLPHFSPVRQFFCMLSCGIDLPFP